jgi:hypothetical protein
MDSVMGVYQQLLRHEEYCKSIHGEKPAKGFLKTPSVRKAGQLLSLIRK